MRSTVDLPDPLFRQVKANAALRGITLRDFFLSAVQRELANREVPQRRRVEPPLIRSRRPGKVALTNAQIEDLLAGH